MYKNNFILKQLIFVSLFLSTQLMASNLSSQLLNMPITLTSGQVVTLAEYQNKHPVYVKFWATWCRPCLQEMPHFENTYQKYGDKLKVIGINLGINDDLKAVTTLQKKLGLSMPMAIDQNGDLAQAFRLLGTPYHLLFDQQMNLVHIGNQANTELDNKIGLVSQKKPVELLNVKKISETEANIPIDLNDGQVYALFFSATWCDWYLKDSRPAISKHCITSQKNMNHLSKKYSKIKWQGVLTRLWTGKDEHKKYQQKFNIIYPLAVDYSNSLFHRLNIKYLPTLLLIKDGKILFRTSKNSSLLEIESQLSKDLMS